MSERELIKEFTVEYRDWQVVKINKVYDIREFNTLKQKLEKVNRKLQENRIKKIDFKKQEIQITKLTNELFILVRTITQPKIDKNQTKHSYCFITMSTKLSVIDILDY